jgi:hypothetical protein
MATPEQIQRRGRWSLVLGTVVAALVLVALAHGDNVVNTLDTTVDATKETMSLTVGAGNGSTRVWVQNVNVGGGDTNNACNLAGAASLIVNVQSTNTSVATVSPSTVTIDDCSMGNTADPAEVAKMRLITVSPVSAGSADITFSQSSFNGSGTFNYSTASFTVNVAPPADSTAPVITPTVSGTLGNNGWYVSDITVSWSVVDNESAISSSSGCGSTTITTDTDGTTLTCSATSAGGTSSQSVTVKRDATEPTVSGSASPAPNGNGWNRTDVTISFTCSDLLSGIASCAPNQTLSSEGAGQSATGTATDNAGNSASATVGNINIDKTAPTATANATPAANANGWNNTDVTITFSGSDPGGSGIDFCDPAVVLSSEGAGQSASGDCTDEAGNVSAPAAVNNISIDKTLPSLAWTGGPADGSSHYFGSVPAAPTCVSADALSGPDGCVVTGYVTTVGSHTMTATAKDEAGNTYSEQRSYTVLAWTLNGFFQPVDMGSAVWNAVKGGSTVPLKFRVFAGSTELTDTSVVTLLKAAQVVCSGGAEDLVEELAPTGGTSLRYDPTGRQFVYNWQTPKLPAKCYRVTVGTADGSTLVAGFKLK